MRGRLLSAVALLGIASAPAGATDVGDFELLVAQDLVDVCSAQPTDTYYVEAIHFCHGYVSGAGHYHRAISSGPEIDPIICPPEPRPSRNDAIAVFLDWARANPDRMADPPVEALARSIAEKWPCE